MGWTLAAALLALVPAVDAQELPMDAGRLAHALDRLTNTGRVLYVAAHPDDENTRLLAYLANARHLTVAYLSMTRGGGGQNLIGPEQAELLDVIRTEELLAARRLDAASQRFTRMVDFGYSKSAAETLDVWGRTEALADVVWVIRSFRPDVIVTRFTTEPPNHGHHTASAILAREAFEAAADPERFPEQMKKGVEPWQAERLLHNVSTWRQEPPKDAHELEVGGYDPRLGLGYGELAAISRTEHKSQGFGRAGERGSLVEYFVPVAGSEPASDILEGIELSWRRFGPDAESLIEALERAKNDLDRDAPERALPALVDAHRALDLLPDEPRVRHARAALVDVIAAAAGLFVRATAAQPGAVPASDVDVTVEVLARRPAAVRLQSVRFPGREPQAVGEPLAVEEKKEIIGVASVPSDAPISTPYWLAEPPLAGRHSLADDSLVGEPAAAPPLRVEVDVEIEARPFRLATPVRYAWTDRVHGERTRTFLVVPPATVTPTRRAVMVRDGRPATVTVRVRAGTAAIKGDVSLGLPDGWSAEPPVAPVVLERAGDETIVRFAVQAPAAAEAIVVQPGIEIGGRRWEFREDVIDYAHIPVQTVLQPARLRLAPLRLELPEGPIGYIAGSGDTIADDLAHVGLETEVLDEHVIRSGDLNRYRAIVVGIRAHNTRDVLRGAHQRLMEYVEDGGTLVVQYNTHSTWSPLDQPIGPYPLQLGQERVTDETAEMVAVEPRHPVLEAPNLIGAEDFEGWVQERGLYFAESWDERYQPVFRVHDPDEEALLGSVLVAPHGKGRYVYTGLSFFRQLPAGVPGAYRLLVNLLAPRSGESD